MALLNAHDSLQQMSRSAVYCSCRFIRNGSFREKHTLTNWLTPSKGNAKVNGWTETWPFRLWSWVDTDDLFTLDKKLTTRRIHFSPRKYLMFFLFQPKKNIKFFLQGKMSFEMNWLFQWQLVVLHCKSIRLEFGFVLLQVEIFQIFMIHIRCCGCQHFHWLRMSTASQRFHWTEPIPTKYIQIYRQHLDLRPFQATSWQCWHGLQRWQRNWRSIQLKRKIFRYELVRICVSIEIISQ